jgi:CheY-like chemotaxis protein
VRRYLLVDDNRDFAENLAEILSDRGATCEIADDGEEALARVRQARFDALVTDMRMPGMGGAAVVHAVRRADPGLPAVVITAHAGDADLAAARREGLLAVLHKPVPVPRLVALLASARRDGLVAVVEDDLALLDNVTEILRQDGFAAVTASSVLDADRLGPVRPCAAIVDLRVPGGPDGEAARRLAARFPGLPLVVVTAHPESTPPGASAVFPKPFDPAALLAALERVHSGRSDPS